MGHFATECPTRLRRVESSSHSPEKWGQAERSKRPGPPVRKPPFQTKQESSTSPQKSGIGKEA